MVIKLKDVEPFSYSSKVPITIVDTYQFKTSIQTALLSSVSFN